MSLMHFICFRRLSVRTSFQLHETAKLFIKKETRQPYSECLSLSLNDEDKLLFLFFFPPSPPLPQYQSDLQQKVTVHSCSSQELDLFRGTELHSCFTMCLGLVGSGLEWRWDCLDLID